MDIKRNIHYQIFTDCWTGRYIVSNQLRVTQYNWHDHPMTKKEWHVQWLISLLKRYNLNHLRALKLQEITRKRCLFKQTLNSLKIKQNGDVLIWKMKYNSKKKKNRIECNPPTNRSNKQKNNWIRLMTLLCSIWMTKGFLFSLFSSSCLVARLDGWFQFYNRNIVCRSVCLCVHFYITNMCFYFYFVFYSQVHRLLYGLEYWNICLNDSTVNTTLRAVMCVYQAKCACKIVFFLFLKVIKCLMLSFGINCFEIFINQ